MGTIHCMFCNGKDCKYENYKLWLPDKGYLGINAIDGLYSTFITPEIMAMQRPSTRLLKEFDLVATFVKMNIKSVFNLQTEGEHASCGDGIEKLSGFSYLPEAFIDSGVSYYNFGWTDMDTPDVEMMLDIVNVMGYALENGKKIAVHCHAGLGRTGLSIACYLVYSESMTADDAISLVRGKRPLSVQTKKQTQFVHDFENHLKKVKISFYGVEPALKLLLNSGGLTFEEALSNQRQWINPSESQKLCYIPKVVSAVVLRVINICTQHPDDETEWYKALDAFLQFEGLGNTLEPKMVSVQQEINTLQWSVLDNETDVTFLVQLLLHWLTTLRLPLITEELLEKINSAETAEDQMTCFTKEKLETVNFIIKFFREIPSISRSTLDLSLERMAIYISPHRTLLSNFPTPAPKTVIPQTMRSTIIDSIKSMRAPVDKITFPQKDIMQESVKTLKALTNTVTNYTAINNPLTLENIGMAFMRTKAASASPTTKPPPVAKPVSPIKSTSAPLLPELPPLTILIQILSTIYKTYTVSDNNEAILTSTHQTVFPQNWSLKNEIGLRVKGASLAKVDTGGRESALNGDPEVCDPDDICESVVGDAGIIGNEEKRDTEIVTPEELVPENYENEKIESKEVPESVLATSVFVVTIPEALVEAETTASESINTAETQSDTSVKNTEDVEVLKVDVVAKDQMVTNIPRCVSEEPDVLKPGPLAEPTSVTLEDTNMVIPEII